MNLAQILTALGINAVPALGWLVGDWNSGTTLAVYWCETVIASLFIAVRTVIHSRIAPKRGHYKYAPTEAARQNGANIPFLKHFLPVTLMFSGAHLVFLVAFVFLLTHNGRGDQVRLNFHEVLTGCGLILALQVMDLVIDIVRMKSFPFRWIEQMAERNIGRVMIIHLTIIVGMAVGGMTNGSRGFFLVFVVLKTLNDLNSIVPQYDPDEAPKWLCWLMDKVPANARAKGAAKKQTFAEFWQSGKTEERQRRAKNEQPYTP